MAYLGRKRTHVIFGDSRASESLYKAIKRLNTAKIPFNIEQYSGAGIIEVVDRADVYMKSYPFDVAYIVAGVNDITNKDRSTGRISFRWGSEDALANYLTETRKNSYNQLTKDHPGAKFVFCPLVGLALHKSVRDSTLEQQEMVDNAVWRSNIELHRMRDEHSFYFPYLASPVHRVENSKHKSYYHHLSKDGLHLTESINESWAKQFVKAFERN